MTGYRFQVKNKKNINNHYNHYNPYNHYNDNNFSFNLFLKLHLYHEALYCKKSAVQHIA